MKEEWRAEQRSKAFKHYGLQIMAMAMAMRASWRVGGS